MSVKCLCCEDGTNLSPGWKCGMCGAESSLAAPAGAASAGIPANQSDMGIHISQGITSADVIKSSLPPKENHELAEDLLARFPGVCRAELLEDMVALCFYWMRRGSKREERAACDFLNELQRIAIRNHAMNAETPNPDSTPAKP